ncbi:phage_term_2, phage terminase, large subunit, PBSX family [uncultured Caudovirales phage]|uniref:Phage_term_2, phage terminase, large subunit, PBSX family n=1 Tax=uncultured Caudovirales phage TaxID=2100421 RepID=A0A6J5LVU2_9CAUD|nr:phage_term_2, phage terminase, large subunit, PBSX family [uncultured Caudovirales phage]CAB4160826.1 phage_term_2, phage terminase, large subunit, PBSX family [uncultured Caudovirales phage]CAB4166257.1 phage_term_2, phage terminase, large subunit, PBSX family [uncultured Caudovirales phage]
MPLSKAQDTVAKDSTRFRVVVAGRRFGKTHLAIRELCYHAKEPDKEVWYVAPSYKMARQIVWRKLKNKLTDLNWVIKTNETELTIHLKNGSTISLKGADNYDSLRGVGLDFIVLDEFADIDEAAWYETLRPTLSDKQGRALFIGTPKGIGNWAYEIYQATLEDPTHWRSYSFSTIDGGNVPEEEIEAAKRDLDERTFRQEYLATFETFTGRIYYAFDRQANTRKYIGNTPDVIYIGLDFNIDPMSAVVATRAGDTLHIIDEVRMFSSNTVEMVSEIKQRYPKSKVWVYPDPAGSQRKTSAGGQTDITILANAGFVVKAPRVHTPVRDRINAVNSRLCDTIGIRRLFIDPKCKYTIEGLERQTYKEGSSQPDKESGYDHMNDALGYMVDYLFPVRRDLDPELMKPQRWGHALA